MSFILDTETLEACTLFRVLSRMTTAQRDSTGQVGNQKATRWESRVVETSEVSLRTRLGAGKASHRLAYPCTGG